VGWDAILTSLWQAHLRFATAIKERFDNIKPGLNLQCGSLSLDGVTEQAVADDAVGRVALVLTRAIVDRGTGPSASRSKVRGLSRLAVAQDQGAVDHWDDDDNRVRLGFDQLGQARGRGNQVHADGRWLANWSLPSRALIKSHTRSLSGATCLAPIKSLRMATTPPEASLAAACSAAVNGARAPS